MSPVKPRALLSVYDKTGVVELARSLADLGWELVSSGGTAAAIRDGGVEVTDTAELTGFPAILGHRVATLHPKIHGGLLADPTDSGHQTDMAEHGITPIGLLVANLYPFGSDTAGEIGGHVLEPGIDLIDIGGPAMVRSAAKNHAHVAVVTDPSQYDDVVDEVRRDGSLGAETRRALARAAFAHTAAYDAAIVTWFDESSDESEALPPTIHLALERTDELRYGENPHQVGARYRQAGSTSWWDTVEQHSGLALSYLNLFDTDAAWGLAHDLGAVSGQPAVAIIKHANPCGAAVGTDLADIYQRAYECDSRSAFGGIVAFSEPVDSATVERMVEAAQADVVIAPAYDDGVVDALVAKRKNTRILTAGPPTPDRRSLRQISGSWLVQDAHHFVADPHEWDVVTDRKPTDAEMLDAAFAWRVCGWVKSNSIVLAKDGTAWGIGAGQQNRVEAGEIAAAKAAGRAEGGACASDAFYPFPDGIEAAAAAGVAVIVQPGGSMGDDNNIAKADELGVCMLFTGERHFLH
ncbi:MAG TPA: bifunctional phosphoribosylaminoimidazolecarboxamide formyltransferase/IMP cyclohydrolase [Acidimicrobiales bacterium]|nr:bifunctional phosphoribosylaminoimidazolecarboxamide formyltransferase/IMP cyclohydrolase [Acidimicrobiales bacterium]